MPANPKYLTQSTTQKVLKLFSGIVGGYVIASLFHLCLALWLPNPKEVLVMSTFTLFALWCLLLILPYLLKNGWNILGIYTLIFLILFAIYTWGKQVNPAY